MALCKVWISPEACVCVCVCVFAQYCEPEDKNIKKHMPNDS